MRQNVGAIRVEFLTGLHQFCGGSDIE